jgi:hypothetical protein
LEEEVAMYRLALFVGVVISLLFATPTMAAQPNRGCPAAFEEATVGELVAMWPQFNRADFEAFLRVIDANANDELCFAEQMPPHAAKYGEPFFVANFIDDVSNSQQ